MTWPSGRSHPIVGGATPPIAVHPDLADRIAALSLADDQILFVALGDLWVDTASIEAFWPVEGGSMVMINTVALPCSLTPEQIVEKLKDVALQTGQM